jgi:hypothetical protein
MSCPYIKTKSDISEFNSNAKEIINNDKMDFKTDKDNSKCPYKPAETKKEEEEDSDDEKPTGGCPVMNKGIFLF